jgi:hypothetical protein
LRYLKCCKLDANGNSTGQPRYPNLHQVFVTSRIYGGYAQNPPNGGLDGCLSPEPFAYESGFTVQRAIVAQIDQTNNIADPDPYSGALDYNNAPWFDWGPYLWASGNSPRSDQLVWCNNQIGRCSGLRDLRFGDLNDNTGTYWGDFTHPTATGAAKVSGLLFNFMSGSTASGL